MFCLFIYWQFVIYMHTYDKCDQYAPYSCFWYAQIRFSASLRWCLCNSAEYPLWWGFLICCKSPGGSNGSIS